MIRYPSTEIIEFLQAVDRHLSGEHHMIVIGGAAATLAYRASTTTSDIDTASRITEELRRAVELAKAATGHDIPVALAGVFDAPMNYEDRLQRVQGLRLNCLEVLVPDRHDLACMKMLRGEEHDLQVIAEVHEQTPFDFDVLCDLFINEMSHVTGRLEEKRLNFMGMIHVLFGDDKADEAERLTEGWVASASSSDIYRD